MSCIHHGVLDRESNRPDTLQHGIAAADATVASHSHIYNEMIRVCMRLSNIGHPPLDSVITCGPRTEKHKMGVPSTGNGGTLASLTRLTLSCSMGVQSS